MTAFDRLLLQIDSIIIVLAFVIYLFKAANKGNNESKDSGNKEISMSISENIVPAPGIVSSKSGSTKGEAETIGVDDDEVACAILAAVSTASMIPLDKLKIKSIRVIEN
jgi:hypothetical protein